MTEEFLQIHHAVCKNLCERPRLCSNGWHLAAGFFPFSLSLDGTQFALGVIVSIVLSILIALHLRRQTRLWVSHGSCELCRSPPFTSVGSQWSKTWSNHFSLSPSSCLCVCKEGVACVSVFSPTDKGGASTSISVDYIKGGVASVPISLSEVGVPSVALKVRLFFFCLLSEQA